MAAEMSKVAIMYSGGLDSLIAYNYAKAQGLDPVCIYVNLGHEYAQKEMSSMGDLIATGSPWVPKESEFEYVDLTSLGGILKQRMTNQIIPSRNVLLATIGAMFAPRVWINALDGEQLGKEHDKSVRFFEDTTSLLSFTNEFFQPQTIVESPFAHMSKADTIEWAIRHGVPISVLFATTSCYDGQRGKCGECLTCVKRKIAFHKNGIDEPGYDTEPLNSAYFKELAVQIPKAYAENDFSRFTIGRCEEFLSVFAPNRLKGCPA